MRIFSSFLTLWLFGSVKNVAAFSSEPQTYSEYLDADPVRFKLIDMKADFTFTEYSLDTNVTTGKIFFVDLPGTSW